MSACASLVVYDFCIIRLSALWSPLDWIKSMNHKSKTSLIGPKCNWIIFMFFFSSHLLRIWLWCRSVILLSSLPKWIQPSVHNHWYVMRQFVLFSSPTHSIKFLSRAHPASSTIKGIKKVRITRKLITFDYAKNSAKKICCGPHKGQTWLCITTA